MASRIPSLVAALVHVLTASGVACALLALLAAFAHEWRAMFGWLAVALIIDAVDGPLARAAHVKRHLARFDGERLDLIIDYITYVLVPAVALLQAGFLAGPLGLGLAIGIVMSSLFHFSDTQSKSEDNCFVGFPAIWNVVALYLFAFGASPAVTTGVVAIGITLTFVPLKWVHPVRVRAWRSLTAVMVTLWAVGAGAAVVKGFPADGWARVLLGVTALYAVALTLWHGRAARSA